MKSGKTFEISVIIPLFRCEPYIKELYERLVCVLDGIVDSYEIIFVNDCSDMNDWSIACSLAEQHKEVKGISFSKNTGQHFAITAGLDYSSGNWCVVMDGDLQDIPEEIPKLYKTALEGYDVVQAKRYDRQDNFFKIMGSRIFYKVFKYFVNMENDSTIANFGIYSRRFVGIIKNNRTQNRFFPLLIKWSGVKTKTVDVDHCRRENGKSGYNLKKLVLLGVNNIIAYSDKPLYFSIKIGVAMSLLALSIISYLVFKYFYWGVPVEGWTSLIVSVFLIGGILSFNIGVLGLYISKIFGEVQKQPLYIIDELIGYSEKENQDP